MKLSDLAGRVTDIAGVDTRGERFRLLVVVCGYEGLYEVDVTNLYIPINYMFLDFNYKVLYDLYGTNRRTCLRFFGSANVLDLPQCDTLQVPRPREIEKPLYGDSNLLYQLLFTKYPGQLFVHPDFEALTHES